MNAAMPTANAGAGWVEVGRLTDIPQRGSRIVRGPDGDIAVFRTRTDEVFALLDRCPHRGGPLSQGIVWDHTVTCPLHGWCMHLNDGKAVAPDEGCTPHYPVRVEDGTVFLSLTALSAPE